MDRFAKERLKVNYLSLRPWSRHSLVLLVAGFVYIAIGVAYISDVLSEERQAALVVALNIMPLYYWGFVFSLAGIAAILSSRWPPRHEKWGYVALTGISSGWAAAYFLGVVFHLTPISNITSVLIWSLTAFLWWAISGLSNPPQSLVVMVDDGRS